MGSKMHSGEWNASGVDLVPLWFFQRLELEDDIFRLVCRCVWGEIHNASLQEHRTNIFSFEILGARSILKYAVDNSLFLA